MTDKNTSIQLDEQHFDMCCELSAAAFHRCTNIMLETWFDAPGPQLAMESEDLDIAAYCMAYFNTLTDLWKRYRDLEAQCKKSTKLFGHATMAEEVGLRAAYHAVVAAEADFLAQLDTLCDVSDDDIMDLAGAFDAKLCRTDSCARFHMVVGRILASLQTVEQAHARLSESPEQCKNWPRGFAPKRYGANAAKSATANQPSVCVVVCAGPPIESSAAAGDERRCDERRVCSSC